MATSVQIRQKLAELSGKRADIEKKSGEAQKRKSSKESEAADRRASAERSSSRAMQQSYVRQAESAQKAALAEGKKIADLSKKLADIARDEGSRNKELTTALKSETAANARAADKARKEREKEERRLAELRKADDRLRQRERLADKQRHREEQVRHERSRLEDQATAAALIGQTERRLAERIEAIRAPRQEQLRILYATATPHGDLRVDEEIRRVRAAVKASTHRDQVAIEHLPAVTAGDLLDGLTSFRPHVVHFSGHANENVLVFDDGSVAHGDGHSVTARALKSAVEAPDEPPTLVVLNACKSARQLESLLGKVALAVGMSESIGDVDALTFATRFYRTLAEGQSVSAALATARADMEMNGLPDHDLPTLAALDGVDPTTVRLVIAPD